MSLDAMIAQIQKDLCCGPKTARAYAEKWAALVPPVSVDYNVDIADDQQGIPMVRTTIGERKVWVELTDPILHGRTITRDGRGNLATRED